MWDLAQVVRKWMAKSVETPSRYSRSAWAATLSVAEVLLELVDSRLLPDLSRIKEANIRTVEAQATKRDAEAQLALAQAVEAGNRAILHKRNDAIARAEKARIAAEAAKTQAEVDAIRMDAETRRLEAIGHARANLLSALAQLRAEGGELFVDGKNLEQILQVGLTLADESDG